MSISASQVYEAGQIRHINQDSNNNNEPSPRLITTALPATTTSVRGARSWIRDNLGRGHPVLQDVMLLVSELVTNAVLHSNSRDGGQVTLVMAQCADIIHLDVIDAGSASQPTVHDDPSRENGRGMFLVDRLADCWGIRDNEEGRTVWFEITW